jgi:hypothetical protein
LIAASRTQLGLRFEGQRNRVNMHVHGGIEAKQRRTPLRQLRQVMNRLVIPSTRRRNARLLRALKRIASTKI